jgi:hypothetical protein
MSSEIDVSSHDMSTTLQKDRRRRREGELSEGMDPVDAALLPLAIAIARLSARVATEQHSFTECSKRD